MATVFFVFPAVSGVRSDSKIEQFLNSAGIVEKFNKAKGNKAKGSEGQISPLVKQAEAFALYLNPPRKPKIKPGVTRRSAKPAGPKPKTVSAKFKLIGTCYYAQRPDMSLALIDEPGKGLRWVKQSSEVGHLTIEQIKDSLVVVRDGKKTFELVPERPPKRSLLKKEGEGKEGEGTAAAAPGSRVPAPVNVKAPRIIAEEDTALMGKLISELKTMQTDAESDKAGSDRSDEENAALMEKFISQFKAMRISGEEAKKLGRLGKKLENAGADPNRDLSASRGKKITNSPEPNSPKKK